MHIHILGICGTFMGGLAALAREAGHQVTGCDAGVYPPMSEQLRTLGIELVEGFDAGQMALRPDMFVIGNVVSRARLPDGSARFPLMEAILDVGAPYTSGPQWLAEHVLQGRHVLAVAGTHGKTTTTAMLAWILESAGRQPGFLVGGVPMNFGVSARLGGGSTVQEVASAGAAAAPGRPKQGTAPSGGSDVVSEAFSKSGAATSVGASLDPKLMQRIRQDVQSMHAYAIQDSAGLVKLDAMENPFGLPAGLQAELGRRLGALALNRYPDARVNDLRAALTSYASMPEGYDIMLGNGSDELISLLAMACDVPGASILAPVPGFVMYAMSAQLQGLAFHGVPLTPDFELDVVAMLGAIARHKPAITYLAYPNNPSANLWNEGAISKIIAAVAEQGGLVVMDEAYQPFASRSWLENIRANPAAHSHVLLMRTLSKFGLAGVRLGYMMGPQALIAEVDKVRPPYNISVLNYECALFALEHVEVFAAQAVAIKAQRAIILEAMSDLPGVRAWDSQANMILARVPNAQKTFEGMKTRGVLVKNVSKMHPLLANCLRLTVGTADESRQMLAALKESL